MVRQAPPPARSRGRTTVRPAPKRGGLLKYVVIAVLVSFIVVGAGWYLLAGWLHLPGRSPLSADATSQPASCPDVQFLSIPGTWESRATDDGYAPHSNPRALLLNVTTPLGNEFPGSRADVYTLPYVAQFSNPVAFPPDGQASYNVSRSQGTDKAVRFIADRAKSCPLTDFILVGFSQGAVIAGDIAAQIGAGDGPVKPERVLGVTLVADGRRVPGQAKPVGEEPPGVGAEVALGGLRFPGITMTGKRDNGFGAIADRVYTVCNPRDGICNSPAEPFNPNKIIDNILSLLGMFGNPAHAAYAGYGVDGNGTTTIQWIHNWATGLIRHAPVPPHS